MKILKIYFNQNNQVDVNQVNNIISQFEDENLTNSFKIKENKENEKKEEKRFCCF